MAIKVFNADDHPILRKGITDLIADTDGLEWKGSAANGTEALEKILAIRPDVAILDIEMPEMTGIEVCKALQSAKSPTAVILLTLFKDPGIFKEALAIGARGYLLKESSEEEIIKCIKQVAAGKAYIQAEMSGLLLDQKSDGDNPLQDLTEHEINILKLIASQKTSAEIAGMLFISPKTVTNHRNNISKKLNLSGVQNGLLMWCVENKSRLLSK